MRRLIQALIFLTLMTISVSAYSQRFGIKAGINMSSLNKEGVKDNLGYQGGLTLQCDLPLWFSIQPELMFHVKGARLEDLGNKAFGLGYLELPVNVQWGPRFHDGDIRVFVYASPFIGYAISKDLKDADGNSYDWKNINRFEYGAGAGLGLQLWHFQLTGQYNWSFGKLANNRLAEESFEELFSKSNFGGYTISLAFLF